MTVEQLYNDDVWYNTWRIDCINHIYHNFKLGSNNQLVY